MFEANVELIELLSSYQYQVHVQRVNRITLYDMVYCTTDQKRK